VGGTRFAWTIESRSSADRNHPRGDGLSSPMCVPVSPAPIIFFGTLDLPRRSLSVLYCFDMAAVFSVVRDHLEINYSTSELLPSDMILNLVRVDVTCEDDSRLSAGYALNTLIRLH
jgi:hypothetical protein